ncbi:MAG: hypothetical protein DHS20C16_07920 [Phycisphaerae bacterium]|nr:MAG: hypothetical protein DHS20C16_07920 [Phycisphaerae bacterium]
MLRASLVCAIVGVASVGVPKAQATESVARQWNEVLLDAIRKDFARPTMHARNLWHTSIAMYDAWAVYGDDSFPYMTHEYHSAVDVQAAREETISYAMYRILSWRFENSPGAAISLPTFDALMTTLGYDTNITTTGLNTPASVGNRIAQNVITFGLADGSNEVGGYANQFYAPVNQPLVPSLPGNPEITDPNRWQPLSLLFFVDQGGNVIPFGYPEALSPEWGIVSAFALKDEDLTIYNRQGFDYWVYHDPGPPPMMGTATEELYKSGFEQVVEWSGLLDPTDGSMIDISPGARGNNTLGTNDGTGLDKNPITGIAYAPQVVPAGDYYRILAEFWADGPDSETPPGHWFVVANYVSDYPGFEKRFEGQGPILDDLEWDVKLYMALASTVHDVAVSAWGVKGWYDYIRPVSAIRYMSDLGQCTDPLAASFHPQGINLKQRHIELVTADSTAPGKRHEHLAGNEGKIAVKAWRGPDFIADPETDTAGVDWILAENWWPYQRPSFVTPPFPGYVSGHSTFSRAAAELMTRITGSEYFPGGLGEFHCPQNEYLVFEEGPSQDITLQWARYYDASDECSLSRIYGGIHPTADDIPGRLMGSEMGADSFELAEDYFSGTAYTVFKDCFTGPGVSPSPTCTRADKDDDNDVDLEDFAELMRATD